MEYLSFSVHLAHTLMDGRRIRNSVPLALAYRIHGNAGAVGNSPYRAPALPAGPRVIVALKSAVLCKPQNLEIIGFRNTGCQLC
jgi:hypothetical protein